MKSLKIKNFKAFGDDMVEFGETTKDGKPMNILCYGENGVGKSSVFEAIKFVFHQQRLRRERNIAHLEGQPLANALRQMKIDYLHKGAADLEIEVNNRAWENFSVENYHIYMVSGGLLQVADHIDVRDLLKEGYLGVHDIDAELTEEVYGLIVSEINHALEQCFFEDVRVSKSEGGEFLLKIDDDYRHLGSDGDLHKIFNEAKLHLVSLLAILSAIEIMAPAGANIKKILVLDDFITSLDMANRSFLYQYIIKKFGRYQIIIFTHNTSFYNLCDHFISEDKEQQGKWLRQGLFEYNHNHVVYRLDKSDTIKKLAQRLYDHPEDVHNIGNDVRRYFEVLLHRLSMLLMAGAKEETTGILAEISKRLEHRVFKISDSKVYYMHDLVDSLMNVVANVPEKRQLEVIKKKLNQYSGVQDTDKLSENLQAMLIYQKVALHQSSHGHSGLPDLSAKEIKASLILMKKIESTIDKLKIERI